ncbi:hypothetical protein H2248_009043 [Termitomyces sp. 'cryptogamus']|nr:hypothetical protein H2248_009043 [Termitomyces sp. 'cryptogamus']
MYPDPPSSSSSAAATFATPFSTYNLYSNGGTLLPLPKQLFMPPPDTSFMHHQKLPTPHYPSASHSPTPVPAPSPSNYAPPPLQSQPVHLPPSPTPSPPSPPPQPKVQNPVVEWAVWSRRPQDPTQAPGIIISPGAMPPPYVVQHALELPTPPMTPVLLIEEFEPDSPFPPPQTEAQPDLKPGSEHEHTSESPLSESGAAPSSTIPSSSGTEITDLDTPAAASPATSVTSLSASLENNASKIVSASSTSAIVLPSSLLLPEPVLTPTPTPVSHAPKKSWASLLQSTSSAPPSPGQRRLPTSNVVGISVPASTPQQPSSVPSNSSSKLQQRTTFAHPALSLPHTKRNELLALLTSAPENGSVPVIRPRGLINSGNMCFANSVLQVLLFCPPFHRLFTELGRYGFGFRAGDEKEVKGPTPLVDAMVEFVREFSPAPRSRTKVNDIMNSKGKGKERDESGGEADDDGAAFLPSYMYDAMKEKTMFDGMRSGQQEDAEEFLGFFLDALEEELLAVVQALSGSPPPVKKAKAKAKKTENGVEEREVEEEREDGWLEVGKRNRMVITRTIKVVETPITRIFGGKARSTLKSPGQKDSTTIEAWRALRLDIQTDSIHTVQDALTHMAAPQPLELDSARHASIQHLLEALPPVLVVAFKRFFYDKDVGGVVKVGKAVQWDEELEVGGDIMAPALRRPPAARYKLFGALYHHGLSASGGHYTLDVLHPGRNVAEGWMRIDDELVSDVRLEDVFVPQHEDENKAAYLLFYRRIR